MEWREKESEREKSEMLDVPLKYVVSIKLLVSYKLPSYFFRLNGLIECCLLYFININIKYNLEDIFSILTADIGLYTYFYSNTTYSLSSSASFKLKPRKVVCMNA